MKGAGLLIDRPYRETASYAKQPSPELYNEYYVLCLCDSTNLLQPFVKMLKTTSSVISIKLTAGYDGQHDVALGVKSVN